MPEQTIVLNRRARHEYAIDETLEAGNDQAVWAAPLPRSTPSEAHRHPS